MRVLEGEYFVARDEKKNILAIAMEKSPPTGMFKARRIEQGVARHPTSDDEILLERNDVLCVLGRTPTAGKAYGVSAENYYRRTLRHEFWGPIHVMCDLPDGFLKRLKPAMDKTMERLIKFGLESLNTKFESQLRHGDGKHAGMYHWHNAPLEESYTDRLTLYPNVIQLASEEQTMEDILYHEFGHSVRHNCITRPAAYSAWIRTFSATAAIRQISAKEFRTHLQRMIKMYRAEEIKTVNEYARSFKEEKDADDQKAVLTAAIRLMHKTHRIGAREVNALLAGDKIEALEEAWPGHDFDTSELEPIVSEYGTKNVEEFWSESFMMYMSKKKLPKLITGLMEKSLTVAKDMLRG